MNDIAISLADQYNKPVAAGAGADGHGVISGYRGLGGMQRGTLVALARRAGLPSEWLPLPKEPRVQLARAVASVASEFGRLVARQEKKAQRQVAEAREPVSRWFMIRDVASSGGGKAGEAYGNIVAVVTLYDAGGLPELVFDTDNAQLERRVREDFEERINAVMFDAVDVTRWLNEVHRDRLDAVRYGFGWYVPRVHRAEAEEICTAFWNEARWGESWCDPPLPVATSAQLAVGIANGLMMEVDEILEDLSQRREKIRADRPGEKPPADIGPTAAENFMIRFGRVSQRIVAYSDLLGADGVEECRDRINDAMIELDAVLDGGVDANAEWTRAQAARMGNGGVL